MTVLAWVVSGESRWLSKGSHGHRQVHTHSLLPRAAPCCPVLPRDSAMRTPSPGPNGDSLVSDCDPPGPAELSKPFLLIAALGVCYSYESSLGHEGSEREGARSPLSRTGRPSCHPARLSFWLWAPPGRGSLDNTAKCSRRVPPLSQQLDSDGSHHIPGSPQHGHSD